MPLSPIATSGPSFGADTSSGRNWSLARISEALLGDHTSSWDPQHRLSTPYVFDSRVDQDMSAPLSHYFISSGHNSYLTSDQIMGDCGTSTIIAVRGLIPLHGETRREVLHA